MGKELRKVNYRGLTMSPLPSFNNLIKSCLLLSRDCDISTWSKGNQKGYWLSKSSQSLGILAELCIRISKEKTAVILLPSYMCNEALDYIRDLSVKIVFYPLNDDLSPNKLEFLRISKAYKPDLILIVHFFGVEIDGSFMREYCTKNSVFLVEDAVHCIKPINGIGSYGDFVIYSPHKYFPVPQGALLIINSSAQLKITNMNVIELLDNLIARFHIERKNPKNSNNLWLIKRILQKMGIVLHLPELNNFQNNLSSRKLSNFKGLNFSRKLLSTEIKSIPLIVKQRNGVKQSISNFLKSSFASEIFSVREEMSAGYYLVLKFRDENYLASVYECFRKSGLPVLRWPDLPPEVIADPIFFNCAISFHKFHLFIPTHQSIKNQALKKTFSKIIKNQLIGWNCKNINQENWNLHSKKIKSPVPLTQEWEYSEAKNNISNNNCARKVIINSENKVISIVQITKKNIMGNYFGLVRINRGPLVVTGYEEATIANHALMSISFLCSMKFGYLFRILSIAPQLSIKDAMAPFFNLIKLYRIPLKAYITGYLSLKENEHQLFDNLNSKWRNLLRKALKNKINIIEEKINLEVVNKLILSYERYQVDRKFNGISSKLIHEIAFQYSKIQNFKLFTACIEGRVVGQLVSVGSANTATYLLSITNEEGKIKQANTALLWHAIITAKSDGFLWYDLGGLNAEKISHFKIGVNPEIYEYAGEWINFA